ncbi:CopG family transcriptional regulator [Halobacteriales archaeon QS_5_70_15]|nr:MAG: CopG family transcriptional regulator [Halobacteriales archaeon QS_5_70_15]
MERLRGATERTIWSPKFKLTESFLKGIGDTWQGRGFDSRSEFIRCVLRDAVEFLTFDRDELVARIEGEADIREGRTRPAIGSARVMSDDGWR